MDVIREGGLVDEIMLSFRYILQSKELYLNVVSELERLNIPFTMYDPSPRVTTFRIIIDEIQEHFFDPDLIADINKKYKIPEGSYDFFLGITSRFEMGGFSIPVNVIKAICIIGGKVEVSYASG